MHLVVARSILRFIIQELKASGIHLRMICVLLAVLNALMGYININIPFQRGSEQMTDYYAELNFQHH